MDTLGDLTASRTETVRTFTERVGAVSAAGGTGEVTVTALPGQRELRVRTLVHDGWTRARTSAEVVGGELRLRSECEGGGWLSPCETSWEVTVPEGLALDLRTGTGDQLLTGTFGAVTARAGTGDVRWDGTGTSLDAQTGTGELHLDGDVARVSARTGTGDVEARFTRPPEAVDVTAGTGDVTLALPEVVGGYDATTSSGTGEQRVDPPLLERDSPRRVQVRTSTGDAQVLVLP
ncbi:DUF4097 family beta strand repeat-containing protein [Kineococcus indalonis]|uniref:DUF4097 family beta strand repeat-containing protein n=1 Tax=Kineococcus indalonis TaxID=2696566 RepID=UPI001411C26E|nr:DUF4097 family beta strand repeat-containing protein [Kineococcus indalonis]NAZ86973.1 DUF4097 family beta strand repeat protein [Kineococcus indalonis]